MSPTFVPAAAAAAAAAILLLACVVAPPQPVAAFTNGTILPSYLCGPANDGLPKSLGGVIALCEEGDAQQKLAAYHGKSTSLTASYGLATATSTLPAVIPGQTFPITVTALGDGARLLGLLTWFEDQYGKLGHWAAFGPNMAAHPQCATTLGPGGTLLPTVATHLLALVDATPPPADPATYTGLVWQAPAVMYSSTVMVKGLAIVHGAFGFWNATFPVQGANTATVPFAQSNAAPQPVLKCVQSGTAAAAASSSSSSSSSNFVPVYGRDAPYRVGGLPPRRK
ncbi:hypothetical protein DFJ73DRAFT_792887 [Zopfochytrium polystomum]|nr:hypothetical protein DFJ73DRAFT_792887 [Zopfochytrium polystomum]